MGRTSVHALVVLAVTLLTACDSPHSPTAPPPVPDGTPLIMPAIRGLVRETNGGPIAGASVRLSWNGPETVSDASGVFAFPAAPCNPNLTNFEVFSATHWFPVARIPACVRASGPSEVSVELKGQVRLNVVLDTELQTVLSNDDLNWIDNSDGYACGPCKVLLMDPPQRFPLELRVDWSTDDPLRVWLEGDDYYTTVKLVERLATTGERGVTVVFPDAWSKYDSFELKVGLPPGVALTHVISIRVTARATSR
jgi:hypothetical protein